MKFLVKWLISFVLAKPKLKHKLQGLVASQPRFDFWLRNSFLPILLRERNTITLAKNENKADFDAVKDIILDQVTIKFHTAALADERGIGRVSKALLQELERASNKNTLVSTSNDNSEIHFYPTIHWCPKQLPQPSCILVHDVIPMLFPESFGQTAIHWEKNLKGIAQQATKIITISHSSAKDIAHHLQIPKEKIDVIYNGIVALEQADEDITKKPEPYVVYLGSADVHKNLIVILKALQQLKNTPIKLYLVGRNESLMKQANKLGVEDKIKIFGQVDDITVSQILSQAIALVFPSLYEGFGLPPFEAALLGTPSICSRKPAMTELLEDACIFCDADDPTMWAEAIKEYWCNETLRKNMTIKAQHIAEQLTWEKSAEQYLITLSEMRKL